MELRRAVASRATVTGACRSSRNWRDCRSNAGAMRLAVEAARASTRYLGPRLPFPYWSATTVARFPGRAWGSDFGGGPVDSGGKTLLLYVRAVRSGL